MAAVRTPAVHHYVGLAADTKPTTDVPAGSEFLELDTAAEYIFNGTATWHRKNTSGYSAVVTVTRPANTTPYTANDVVGAAAAALTFPNMGPSGAEILLTSNALEVYVAGVPAGMVNMRLYLYNVTPPSALADNAAWDLPAGDRDSYLGFVDFGTPVDLGSTLAVQQDGINKQVKLAGTSLFGYLVTTGGFTPAGNSEVYRITLKSAAL